MVATKGKPENKPPSAPQSSSTAALLGPPNHFLPCRPHIPGCSAWPPSSMPCPCPASGHCCFGFATDCSSCVPPSWSAAHLQPNRCTQADVSHLMRLLWGQFGNHGSVSFHFLMIEEDISGLQAAFGRKASYGFERVPAL